ncbi:GH3 auxin-responsive promoter family protein [Haoranjiania flava]|uniref:GH3 auxin-responsive promoter family protein n=1 Tax=Haoranjiania flava TaxID=1856322 RepID=A0AAE3IKM6_9BACT|nr:GH3 auxin-responsive promoter family protein [Haoranjiania flava]MCU7693439.1 GH3 auxin-responsive promoter family protein [Haoranjiania flava]
MKFISPTVSKLARLRYKNIKEWMDHPLETQRNVMQELIAHGQYTSFGMQYDFNNIFNLADFRKHVPVQEYTELKPYVDRLMNGENNVLWNTPVTWFAKSSGTTSDKSKFIPITEESLADCHYKAAKDVITLFLYENPNSQLLSGKGLVIGGSHQISQLNEEIFYGDLSAVLLQNSPFYAQWMKTPQLSIALMDEWESKIEAIAQTTINEEVTSISGVPTWTLVLLKRILEITGKKNIKEVWPNFELYMHGGVSFTPYREQFKKILGENVCYRDMYNASEGFFAAQDQADAEGMLLMLDHGIYYEFMPVEEYGKDQPATLSLAEVELNKKYAIVISTNGGLWRYIPGDTVEFTTLYPFRIKVVGRLKHFINAFGEELIVENADTAIFNTSKELDISVTEYTAAPVYFSENENGAHEWLFEFEKEPEDMQLFAETLDRELKKTNSDYEAKRHRDIALRLPVIHALPRGSFQRWLKEKGKLGGQHKVPRLSNDRQYLEEVLATINHE